MKKRLRKKKHRGEFTEWGRQLIVMRNRKDNFDEFLDAFIAEAVEANGCYCGGGGKGDNLDVVIELGGRSDDRETRLKKITAWIDARPDVQSWKTSAEFDIWRGNFTEITEKVEHPASGAAEKQRA